MICFFGHNYSKIPVQIGKIGLGIYCFKDVVFSWPCRTHIGTTLCLCVCSTDWYITGFFLNVLFVCLQYRLVTLGLNLGYCVHGHAVQIVTIGRRCTVSRTLCSWVCSTDWDRLDFSPPMILLLQVIHMCTYRTFPKGRVVFQKGCMYY